MNYNLFLDDVRFPDQVTWVNLPPVEWTIVRSYEEFMNTILKNGLPNFISFDHDLASEHYPINEPNGGINTTKIPYATYKERTGYHCARWLVQYCLYHKLDIPRYEVHSMNPIGKENIQSLMENGRRIRNS